MKIDIRTAPLMAAIMALSSCGTAVDNSPSTSELSNIAASGPSPPANLGNDITGGQLDTPIPVVSHNYNYKNGPIYQYVSSVSDDQKKSGRSSGDVISFAYLGFHAKKYVLAQVDDTDAVISYAYCENPCRVITFSNDTPIEYTERSVVGAALSDAMAGKLELALVTHKNITKENSEPPASEGLHDGDNDSAPTASLLNSAESAADINSYKPIKY